MPSVVYYNADSPAATMHWMVDAKNARKGAKRAQEDLKILVQDYTEYCEHWSPFFKD